MRKLSAAAAILLTLQSGLGVAWGEELEFTWDKLAPQVAGRKVSLMLPDGTRVAGKALAVQPDGLRMRVQKTSDRKVQPKGERVIPRSSISTLQATRYGIKWRIIGALAAPVTVAAIMLANKPTGLEGSLVIAIPVIGAVAAVGTAFAGYYIGKRADKRVTDIRVLP